MGGDRRRAAAHGAAEVAARSRRWSCTASADTLIRPEAGRHTAQCIPGAEYHEIEGWGHDMPLEAIPVVQGYILPFIARVEAERKRGA